VRSRPLIFALRIPVPVGVDAFDDGRLLPQGDRNLDGSRRGMTVQTDLLDDHELSFDDKPFLNNRDNCQVPSIRTAGSIKI